MDQQEPPSNSANSDGRVKNHLIVLVASSILFILMFFHPAMFLNDEWITGNQLSQLYQGHQILFAESKYGFDDNGAPYNYFRGKNFILQYTPYLPLLSYPFLILVKIIGPSMPFIVATGWSFLLISLGLFIRKTEIFDNYSQKIANILITLSFVIFFLNLFFYTPLNINTKDSYDELFGVGFYHLILLILLIGIVFSICKDIFSEPLYTLFASISCISCSSFLFWTISLKDHIDSVFVVSLILYFLIRFQKTHDYWYFTSCFVLSAILTWIRPEYGTIMVITIFAIQFITFFSHSSNNTTAQKLLVLLNPFTFGIGIIPLLIGNYFITGSPLKMAWQVIVPNNSISAGITPTIPAQTTIQTIALTIIERTTPHSTTVLQDIYGFLINPITLKIPLLALTPLFFFGILVLPFLYITIEKKIVQEEWITIAILMALICTTIGTYASSITGLNSSLGIYPDVRYLTPTYLPLNLMGLIIIRKIIPNESVIKQTLKYFFVFCIIGIAVGIGVVTIFHSKGNFWDILLPMNGIIPIILYLIIFIAFILFCRNIIKRSIKCYYSPIIASLIAIPLIWQVTTIYLVGLYPMTFISYPPLLPIMNALFSFLALFGA